MSCAAHVLWGSVVLNQAGLRPSQASTLFHASNHGFLEVLAPALDECLPIGRDLGYLTRFGLHLVCAGCMRLQACVSTLQTFASFKFLNSVRMRTQIPLVDLGYLTRFGLQSCLRPMYASSSLLFQPGFQPWLQSPSR